MENLLKNFENKKPEIVFKWKDPYTDAEGWIVINSLKGGAAAGGTRMRIGVNEEEVTALAKTMEVKFTVAGPSIGGAKSGINFNPKDPRKKEVLNRWYKAARSLLKTYYGTGGDMNVDEVEDVIPICKKQGILFPLEGVINGHYNKTTEEKNKIFKQLSEGVPFIITNACLTPNPQKKYTVGDLITGYGVSESIKHYYSIYGGELQNKKVIIQGWGNVAGSAAYYLAQLGAKIVGIIDKNGGIINQDGFDFKYISDLLQKRTSNHLELDEMMSFDLVNREIWNVGADIFVPAAASRIVTQEQIDTMINHGLELISSGANVPFADKEIFFGPISKNVDNRISVIPDFIANCGMARAFSYFMEEDIEISDIPIFEAVSNTIKKSMKKTYEANPYKKNISRTSLEIALNQLI
ncbi:MAG: amino acid dehydrogenase [Flavobacteriales bacterium]|nr:amino acid dehydrogenase [Flavobacteriales bacterium]